MTRDTLPVRGWTVPRLAKLLCVSAEKIRGWIRRGELTAINTTTRRGRVRYVILPHHLAEFERHHRAATVTPTPAPRRRRRPADWVDYYPD